MTENQKKQIEELNKELDRRMEAIPESGNHNMFDGGQTPYDGIRDWYLEEKKKILNIE